MGQRQKREQTCDSSVSEVIIHTCTVTYIVLALCVYSCVASASMTLNGLQQFARLPMPRLVMQRVRLNSVTYCVCYIS